MVRDYDQRTTDAMHSNVARGAALTELEMILEGERRKARDLKGQMEAELEGEKRSRIDFENRMIRLKEEAQKREMYVSELEYDFANSKCA